WKSRQGRDSFAREARVQGLKSRAAFKLLEIDSKYKLFKRGQTVIDLVAVERTKPSGRIIGIDIIPAQPPKGVSTIQGNFLSPAVQDEVKRFLSDPNRGRPKQQLVTSTPTTPTGSGQLDVLVDNESYVDHERHLDGEALRNPAGDALGNGSTQDKGKMVDVVLSDMMMNTSGINFKDHAGSMDLCAAALRFSYDTLRVGGHFVCKFYQGVEDKHLETQLKKLFAVVHREKPESSRNVSWHTPSPAGCSF
ncbi:hypothetical protein DH86_00001603, partial [Scytalidium sp. 3C]